MPIYDPDIDMPDDDDETYEGPDAYLDSDDDALQLELEDGRPPSGEDLGSTPISHLLRSLFDLQQLQPGSATDRITLTNASGAPLTYDQVVRWVRVRTSGRRATEEEEDDDDDDDDEYTGTYSNPYGNRQWFPPHIEPQERGVELLMSGEFGRLSNKIRSRNGCMNIARQLLDQSCRPRAVFMEELTNGLIPNTNGTAVASNGANLYVGQFSKDSSFYYTCCQDFRLYVYDMASPPAKHFTSQRTPGRRAFFDTYDHDHESTLKVLKTIQGHPGRWTITDSHLSPENERIIYSSISPTIYMTNTLDSSTVQTPIRFADQDRRRGRSVWGAYDEESFGIWSCRFSADGNEVIAGGNGHIFVYDLLANRRTVKISAHSDDVNSCCWADTASGNVLISASDDTFIKVWDRRSLGASPKPSGVLVGHTEGITNVSAKGDGRYVISNGKDQALRLWDLRKMCSSDEFESFADQNYRRRDFDYRRGHFPKPKRAAHPNDCSVMTYRGHTVLRTLIRCNFSPAETTGCQYIYSGSADGKIHIWSLDGRIVQVLDRSQTLPMACDPSGPEISTQPGPRGSVCVRDVSWSTREPVLMSVGWECSRDGGSVVARHEWKGLSKMGYSLDDLTEKQRAELAERGTRQPARNIRIPGAFEDEDEDESE